MLKVGLLTELIEQVDKLAELNQTLKFKIRALEYSLKHDSFGCHDDKELVGMLNRLERELD